MQPMDSNESQEKHPGGRPSIYTKELADKICSQLAEGVSLRTVCLQEEMPSLQTIFRWIREKQEFSEQYARAKQESADAMADEILDISDDGTNDWEEVERNDGSTFVKLNSEAVQRSKLRVDTRKWLMAKMKPKKYGDQIDITSKGEKIAVLPAEIYAKHDAPSSPEQDS